MTNPSMTKCELDKLQDDYVRSWPSNHAAGKTAALWDVLKNVLTEEQQTQLYHKAVAHANQLEEQDGSNFRYVVGVNTEF